MRPIFLLTCLLFLFQSSHLCAQPRHSLLSALKSRLIQVKTEGKGGFQGKCIRLIISNKSTNSLTIEVPPGQMFISGDSSVQDLIVTQREEVVLIPGAIRAVELYTMCTQSYNAGPSQGEDFVLGEMAEGHLLSLVQTIDSGHYQNSSAQSAVWSVANREPVSCIYGEDTSMIRRLAREVSGATGIPISQFMLVPRAHHITSINTSLETLINKHLSRAQLALFDRAGRRIRTYFQDRKVEKGFMQWRVGASHTLGDSAVLYLRLSEGDSVIFEKQISATDSITPLKRYHSQAVLIYEAKTDLRADIGVYDAEGNLYFILAENKLIPKGMHRSTYIVGKDLPENQRFEVRIVTQGNVLAGEVLNPDAPVPVVYPPRTVSGAYAFDIDQPLHNVRLAIYDAEGRPKRILYDIAVMNPGHKRFTYSFEHRDGPEARFYLRLTDTEGNTLQEKEIW
ncbi:MAG: hypothetical protein EAZ89_16830 [Bacteroidetes bacterium]|nr:MAG: hypothetical protein EAZ89_16830 [Bacteroidota bacterium]